jgi:hypothetical protein
MTSVNMPRDDAATKITSKTTTRTVNPVEPYSNVQPVEAHEDVTQAPPRKTRKQDERRGKDRRQKNEPVLLDTRSNHDRRNAAAKGDIEIEDENSSTNKTGVDYFT